jgi:hypothetical protein
MEDYAASIIRVEAHSKQETTIKNEAITATSVASQTTQRYIPNAELFTITTVKPQILHNPSYSTQESER